MTFAISFEAVFKLDVHTKIYNNNSRKAALRHFESTFLWDQGDSHLDPLILATFDATISRKVYLLKTTHPKKFIISLSRHQGRRLSAIAVRSMESHTYSLLQNVAIVAKVDVLPHEKRRRTTLPTGSCK